MKTRTVMFASADLRAEIVVSEANILMGARRLVLIDDARRSAQAEATARSAAGCEPVQDRARDFVREWVYPPLIAATLEARIERVVPAVDTGDTGEPERGEPLPWPLPVDEFLHLPDQLWDEWSSAVYALNPGWLPRPVDVEAAQKKAMSSTWTSPAT